MCAVHDGAVDVPAISTTVLGEHATPSSPIAARGGRNGQAGRGRSTRDNRGITFN